MDVMVSNCNELERPTAPGVSPQRPTLLFILLKLRLYFVSVLWALDIDYALAN